MANRSVEVEIKLAVVDPSRIRRQLRRLGFTFEQRVLEHDVVFDTAGGTLRQAQKLLRLRRAGKRWLLTFKDTPLTDPVSASPVPGAAPDQTASSRVPRYKARPEIETNIEDGARLTRILDQLGYRPAFIYEKQRATYRQGQGIAALDRTPIGTFLELEGPRKWIDRTARALGFHPADYETRSYASLYREDCRKRGVEPRHMVFRP